MKSGATGVSARKVWLAVAWVMSGVHLDANPVGDSIPAVEWHTSFDAAREQAQRERKKLFILFTDSEYCRPCKELHRTVLESDAFRAFARDKLVLFKADEAHARKDASGELASQTERLAKTYPHRGVPWVFIARASGTAIGSTGGYLGESPDRYIDERLRRIVR